MIKLIHLFLFLFFVSTVAGQIDIKGQIIDGTSESPLPYANIGILHSNIGTVSDELGIFTLRLRSQDDMLLISYIGYQTLTIAAKDLRSDMVISLEPESVLMEEISVSATRYKEDVMLGLRNENGRGPSVGYGNPQLGTELGTVIRVDRETYVKSVSFVLNHAKGDSVLFRINFYDFSTGKVGEKVVRKNIFLKEKQRKGTYTINLESEDITLTNDVLVSVEWLKDFGAGDNSLITFDTKKSKKDFGVYIRSSQTSDFKKMDGQKKFKPCFYLTGMQ